MPFASKGRRICWNDTASRSTTVANPVLRGQQALIVCQAIRPAQVRATAAGRLIWHRTVSRGSSSGRRRLGQVPEAMKAARM